MTLKAYLTVLAILTTITFSGCSWCEKTIYVDRPVEVLVPVKCEIPAVDCEFSGLGATPAVKAFECISNQKRAMESVNAKK